MAVDVAAPNSFMVIHQAPYLFSKCLKDQGLHLPRLKAVVTTAEMLQPHYRERIQEWLKCPVYDTLFGSNDGGIESYECKLHQGLHYNDLQMGSSGSTSTAPIQTLATC